MAAPSPQRPTRDKSPMASPAARLAPLVGRWHFDGDVVAGSGPTAKWSSEEHCSWLPGKHFLVNQWDARVGGREFKGMAVFGHDTGAGYFAHFYDNAGHHPGYELTIDGDTWTLSGESQRAVYEFGGDDDRLHIRWETRDGDGWHPLCELSGRRITEH